MFRSKKVYELCFRADRGLPLPARPIINLLIRAAIARTQRDDKVLICNYVWMPNHPHLSFISQDINALKNFYGELKKRITDMLKRLLGLKHLNVWPKEPTVAEILDLEEAIQRHVYFFLNPVRASLVNSIDEYPGENTWNAFTTLEASLEAKIEIQIPWIRLPTIPRLSHPNPSSIEELRVIDQLLSRNNEMEKLTYYPFAWIKAFGVKEPQDCAAIRDRIVAQVRASERAILLERKKTGKFVLRAKRLTQEPITINGYKPKKEARTIFFLSSLKALRLSFLETFRRFRQDCHQCYRRACLGATNIIWPPGAYVPPLPPVVNPL